MFPFCCKRLFYCFVILQPDHDDDDADADADADAAAADDDDDNDDDDDDDDDAVVDEDDEAYQGDTDVLAMAWLTTPCLSAYCLQNEYY